MSVQSSHKLFTVSTDYPHKNFKLPFQGKVGGNKPAGADFGDVLNSAANASATEATPKQTEEETQ